MMGKMGNMPQDVHEPFRPGARRSMQGGVSDGVPSGDSDRAGYKFKCGKQAPYTQATEQYRAAAGSALALRRGESRISSCRREFAGGAKLVRVDRFSARKRTGFSRNAGRTDRVGCVSLERLSVLPTES